MVGFIFRVINAGRKVDIFSLSFLTLHGLAEEVPSHRMNRAKY